MEVTKFTGAIVGLAVIVLMIVSVIPLIEDAQAEQVTEYNNESARYRSVLSTESITITMGSGFVTINDYTFQYPGSNVGLLRSDNFNVRYAGTNTIYLRDLAIPTLVTLSTPGSTIVIEDGTWTSGVATGSIVGDLYVLSEDGPYGEFFVDASNKLYVNEDSKLSFFLSGTLSAEGQTSISYYAIVEGTLKDLKVISLATESDALDVTDTSVVLNASDYTDVDGVCYELVNLSGTLTYKTGGVTYTSAYSNPSFTYAPIKYIALSDNDSMMVALIGIIPLLLIIVAVLYAVRLMGSRN